MRTCFKWKAHRSHLKACVPGLRVVSTSSFDPNSHCRWPAQPGRQTCSVSIQRSTRTCLRASAGSRNTEPEKMRRSGTYRLFLILHQSMGNFLRRLQNMCEITPVSTTIAESTQCQPRRATDVAPWRTPPSSSLFDIHLTDWSPPTSTRCPFESRSFTCLSVVFVFA